MDNKDKVISVLKTLDLPDLRVEILESRGTRVVPLVVSPGFESMDEGERQAMIWGKLFDNLTDEESRRVEYVFTYSPREIEEEETAARSPG